MANGVFYANSSESVGLYGNTVYFGTTYFEWLIFKVQPGVPATPSGGTWDFNTNTGTVPVGWTSLPPTDYSGSIWMSMAVVDSANPTVIVWSAPGLFTPPLSNNLLYSTGVTGSAILPAGTTAQRDASPQIGYLRFNVSTGYQEVYTGTTWENVVGASGGLGNPIMFENDTVASVDYTVTTGKNGMTAGPFTVNPGVTITVPVGSTWTIV